MAFIEIGFSTKRPLILGRGGAFLLAPADFIR